MFKSYVVNYKNSHVEGDEASVNVVLDEAELKEMHTLYRRLVQLGAILSYTIKEEQKTKVLEHVTSIA